MAYQVEQYWAFKDRAEWLAVDVQHDMNLMTSLEDVMLCEVICFLTLQVLWVYSIQSGFVFLWDPMSENVCASGHICFLYLFLALLLMWVYFPYSDLFLLCFIIINYMSFFWETERVCFVAGREEHLRRIEEWKTVIQIYFIKKINVQWN